MYKVSSFFFPFFFFLVEGPAQSWRSVDECCNIKAHTFLCWVPAGSPSRGGDVAVYVWHKPTVLSHSFLFCSCVCFCLYGPFKCISFHKFPRQLSAFSLCSSGLISVFLVFSTRYLFTNVSLSSDIILCGWLRLTWYSIYLIHPGGKLKLSFDLKVKHNPNWIIHT